MLEILEKMKETNMRDYAPIPFWSWNNALEEDRLLAQIDDMKAEGCGGFIIHARTGLTIEYLSQKWFNLVKACLKRAKELDMNVWIYDENGWPSGFVGGKLLDKIEYQACGVEKKISDKKEENAYAVFGIKDGVRRYLKDGEKSDNGRYENVIVYRSPANTDILNPDVVEDFIKETHEKYYAKFKKSFGKELVGFFTDEPQYFRWGTPFTYSLEKYFKEHYGEDVKEGIIHLFYDRPEDYPFRVKYYSALNDLYVNVYYKRLYDWCESHGVKLTGHSVEESKISWQMWGGAGCAPSYEYQHIPGIDNLTLKMSARIEARQIGTTAGILGKNQILTETFGCAGYCATPSDLLAIAEKQYVHGVNLLCHHLYAYSLKGQGKTDHPPCFSPHMTWRKEFKSFNDYLTKVGYLIAKSEPLINCAVLSPLTSVYLVYNRFNGEKASAYDEKFEGLQDKLTKAGISYDILDEKILNRHGSQEGHSLKVGKRKYDYVILPYIKNLTAKTKELLSDYVKNGGKILVTSRPVYTDGNPDDYSFLSSNVSLSDIKRGGAIDFYTDGNVEYCYRQGDGFKFLYIVNVGDKRARVKIPSGFSKVDIETGTLSAFASDLSLKAGKSIIFTPDEKGEKRVRYGLPNRIRIFDYVKSDFNNLTVDHVAISYDGKKFSKNMPISRVADELLRAKYCGRIYLKYSFRIADRYRGKIRIRREKGKYFTSTVNGYPLSFRESKFDFMFEEADISRYIFDGVNEYVTSLDYYQRPQVFYALFDEKATESLRNCLWYDTEIENVYILGDFAVDTKRRIVPLALPIKELDNLTRTGFFNFAGKITFKAKVFGKESRARLKFRGNFSAVEVTINGKDAGFCWKENFLEITLKKGKINNICVTLVSSLRNMFGPFHYKCDERDGVNPTTYNFRGLWKDGKCPVYRERYLVEKFGLDSVTVRFADVKEEISDAESK